MNNIPYKSLLEHIIDIKERNKAFDALPDEVKRKEIAYDALKLIILEQKVSATGMFSTYWNFFSNIDEDQSPEALQQCLIDMDVKTENCQVCARGAIMLSQIRLGNTIQASDSKKDHGDEKNLKGFNLVSMELMEIVYENWETLTDILIWNERDTDLTHPVISKITGLSIETIEALDNIEVESHIDNYFDKNMNSILMRQYKYDRDARLINILCNVLANGDFDITDFTDYVKNWSIEY